VVSERKTCSLSGGVNDFYHTREWLQIGHCSVAGKEGRMERSLAEGVTWWSRFMAHLVVMDHLEISVFSRIKVSQSGQSFFGRQRRSTSGRKGS